MKKYVVHTGMRQNPMSRPYVRILRRFVNTGGHVVRTPLLVQIFGIPFLDWLGIKTWN